MGKYSCLIVLLAFSCCVYPVEVAGGSVRGSTDHLVVARAMKLAGGDPRRVIYVAYDGGGKAMVGLLSGETQLLSTGFSEAIEMARSGVVRVLGVTSNQRRQ